MDSSNVLERNTRRLLVKVPADEVNILKIRKNGTLELSTEGLTRREKCQQVAGSIMAALSKGNKQQPGAAESGSTDMETES